MTADTSLNSDDPILRPEVLALQRRAEDLRVEAEDAFDMAMFVASLRSDCCQDGCDDPRCYRAWKAYPNG